MSGWIKLHRKLLNCPHIKNANHMSLFVCMLLCANHEDQISAGRNIPRGSFTTGRRELAKQSRISENIARTAIKHFIKHEMIAVENLPGFSIYTIINYDFYQCNCENIQPKNKQKTNPRINPQHNPADNPKNNPINNQLDLLNYQGLETNHSPELNPNNDPDANTKMTQSLTTLKEIKEVKEEKNILSLFESFWKAYTPVKVNNTYVEKGSKKQAMSKFEQILNKGTEYEEIIRGMHKYLNYCQQNEIRSCGVNVFLNQERWLDDYSSTTMDANPSRNQHQNSNSKTAALTQLVNAYRN